MLHQIFRKLTQKWILSNNKLHTAMCIKHFQKTIISVKKIENWCHGMIISHFHLSGGLVCTLVFVGFNVCRSNVYTLVGKQR